MMVFMALYFTPKDLFVYFMPTYIIRAGSGSDSLCVYEIVALVVLLFFFLELVLLLIPPRVSWIVCSFHRHGRFHLVYIIHGSGLKF